MSTNSPGDIDPLSFNPGSLLGVAGIMDIYRAGRVTIANAPGTGIADDKAIYSFMPDIVEFYTGEKPLLANVQTWRCADPDDLKYVLDHLAELVVKEVHGSGGYGMLIGPTASRKEIARFRASSRSVSGGGCRAGSSSACGRSTRSCTISITGRRSSGRAACRCACCARTMPSCPR